MSCFYLEGKDAKSSISVIKNKGKTISKIMNGVIHCLVCITSPPMLLLLYTFIRLPTVVK